MLWGHIICGLVEESFFMVNNGKLAVILAGGLGTRLRKVVSDVPKSLAPIAGRPFLDWLLTRFAGRVWMRYCFF